MRVYKRGYRGVQRFRGGRFVGYTMPPRAAYARQRGRVYGRNLTAAVRARAVRAAVRNSVRNQLYYQTRGRRYGR